MSSETSPCPSASASGRLSRNKKKTQDEARASEARISRLRPYQRQVALAILDSVFSKKGTTFSVEIARQGGKNELSAQLELLLLTVGVG